MEGDFGVYNSKKSNIKSSKGNVNLTNMNTLEFSTSRPFLILEMNYYSVMRE